MKCNVSKKGRIIRGALGLLVLSAIPVLLPGSDWLVAALIVGSLLMLTAVTGFSVMNRLLGVDPAISDIRSLRSVLPDWAPHWSPSPYMPRRRR